jgi:hypothetical protein
MSSTRTLLARMSSVRMSPGRAWRRCGALALACLLLAVACDSRQAPAEGPAANATPAQVVRQLTAHLRNNDLEAFARAAVPPKLHTQLDLAWREGRTRWPLDELPFGSRLPGILGSLAAPGSEARLQRIFDRQFAGANRELRSAASALGVFGTQYVSNEGDYSDDERQHYAQLIAATAQWGARAPLADPARAKAGIAKLAAAARRTGLTSEAAFRDAGLEGGLRRMGPFAAAFKQVLAAYGLKVDADLATLEATLQQQTGDTALVRMRYRFAGQPIDTVVSMERIDGRWYLADYLRHAQAALARPPAQAAPIAEPAAATPSAPAARARR